VTKDFPIYAYELLTQYKSLQRTKRGPFVAIGVGGFLSRLAEPVVQKELCMPNLPPSEAGKTVNVLIAWMLRVAPADRQKAKRLLE
jgi:hypothetical protein